MGQILPLSFRDDNFLLCIYFAININKSGHRTVMHGSNIGDIVYMHGSKYYVAISRVQTRDGLTILIGDDSDNCKNSIVNVVYLEVFQRI
jgi:hypothetical protein